MKSIPKDPSLTGDAAPTLLSDVPARNNNADCYIEVWSDKNCGGEYMRIEGPREYHSIESVGREWVDCISSLRVGPSAFVLVYSEKDFKGTMMSFGPGQQVPNLEELKFNDAIDSLKLVNSIKIFEEFRSEEEQKPVAAAGKKRNKGMERLKTRRGGR